MISKCARGQALTEFVFVVFLAVGLVTAGVRWHWAEWRRVVCLRSAFLAAHDRLLHASLTERTVFERVSCGRGHETVTLRTLDSFSGPEAL